MPRATWAFADCRTTPFPGHARSDASLSQGRLRSGAALRAGLHRHRIRSCSASASPRRATSSSFFRHAAADRAGHAESGAGADHARRRDRRLAVGQFHQDLRPLGSTRISTVASVWDGAFPRIAARQTPINVRFALPGGAAALYEPGSEPRSGGAAYDDRTRGRRPASLLDRCTATQHLPEGHRGVRLGGVLGLAHVAGSRRHRRASRHPAARQRAPLLLSGHDARRRTRRIPRRRRRGAGRMRAAGQSRIPQADTTRALDRARWSSGSCTARAPPASRYPLLSDGRAGRRATRRAVGFPEHSGRAAIRRRRW